MHVCGCRLEDHVQLTGPETLLKFDKRMAAATDGLQEGLNWGELVNAGGSPAPFLALHTSHPTEQVTALVLHRFMLVYLCAFCLPLQTEKMQSATRL